MIQIQFGELARLQKLGEKLSTIPGCPRTHGAVEALGEDLAEICNDWDEAEWLVRESRSRWEDWKGRRGLLVLLDNRRRPELPPANIAQELGPKPEVTCRLCDDWGHLEITDGATGQSHQDWCKCPIGEHLKKTFPGFMKMLNRKTGFRMILDRRVDTVAVKERGRITEADIKQAYSERQNGLDSLIFQERCVLENFDASPERKEIARQTLRALGVAETEVSA